MIKSLPMWNFKLNRLLLNRAKLRLLVWVLLTAVIDSDEDGHWDQTVKRVERQKSKTPAKKKARVIESDSEFEEDFKPVKKSVTVDVKSPVKKIKKDLFEFSD